jgi:hypothetical protein
VAKKGKQSRAENKARREREAREFRASLLAPADDELAELLCGWVPSLDLDGWIPDPDAMERLYALLAVRVIIDGTECTSYIQQEERLREDWDDMEYRVQDGLRLRIEALSLHDLQFLLGMASSAEAIRASLEGNQPSDTLQQVKRIRAVKRLPGTRMPSDSHFSIAKLNTRHSPDQTGVRRRDR